MATEYSTLIPGNFVYSEPTKSRRGSNTIWLRDPKTSRNVQFFLPKMRAPFSISKFDDSKPTFNLELNVSDSKVKDWLDAWDAANIKAVMGYKDQLFRKGTTNDEVGGQYRTLAQVKNPAYPPLLRVKVGDRTQVEVVRDGKIQRKPGTLDDITKGSDVQCAVQCVGLYFCNGIWGCTLVCRGLRVYQVPEVKYFEDDLGMEGSDDDDEWAPSSKPVIPNDY